MLQVMKAVWVLAWLLCSECGCLALLEPEVPGSKIAAGHVGVALPTSSCQVGMQDLQICCCSEAWQAQACWKCRIWHIMVQADSMQETEHTQSGVGFNMRCWFERGHIGA